MKRLLMAMALVLVISTQSFSWNLDNPAADKIIGWDNSAPAGTQTTWFGLGTGLEFNGTNIQVQSGVYEPADATILKDADIGVTVQGYSINLDAVTTPGVAGTFLKSDGANVSWDVAGGAGGGTIGGTLGSVGDVILRSDGTDGLTAQGSLVTVSDAGSINIPTGETYKINGSAHTHNYQPADADLTTYAGITPSANVQSVLGAADYSAIRTLLSLRPGTDILATTAIGTTIQAYDADLTTWASLTPSANMQSMSIMTYAQMLTALGAQAADADLTALAGLSGVRGDIIVRGVSAWERLPKGSSGQVLKMTATDPAWGSDLNDGGSGISTWDELGDAAADATVALAGYKTIFTSSLDTGAVWTMTNTDASLSAATSFLDMKATSDGDANLFFARGYDNAGGDLKWSIGRHGAFYGYSFETVQAATGGKLDLLEGAANGTDYVSWKADDDVGTNRRIALSTSVANSEDLTFQLGANDNTVTIGSSTGVSSISFGSIGLSTSGTVLASGIVDGTAPVTITSGDTANIGATYKSGYIFNNNATPANATTYTLPTAALGKQYCVKNIYGSTGALRVNTSAAGQYISLDGDMTASGGYVISDGAAADGACFVGLGGTHWEGYAQKGTWTAN